MNKENTFNYYIMPVFMIVIFVVFMPLLSNDFINYDDQFYVNGNQYVQEGLTVKGIKWAFTTSHVYNWHPLTWLSHMLDVQLFGLNPAWHHLMNLVLHMSNSLFLFLLFRRMTGAAWRSLFVASLFALHPLHVESVAWIAERKDLLSTLLELLAIWVYIDFTRNGKVLHYCLALLFFALGLMAKPMLVTLPFVLLLLDYWPLGRFSGKHNTFPALLLEKVPLLLLSLASSAVTYYVQGKEGAINYYTPLSMNIGNAIISYVKYVAKMFWPHPLAIIYPFNPDEITFLFVGGAGLFLLLTSYFILRHAIHRPYLAVGWFWYLGTLVPVIGFIRIGDHAISDRYTYFPLIGLFIMIIWGINEIFEYFRIKKEIGIVLFASTIAVLSYITIQQGKYWRNSFTLFEHAIQVTENNAPAHKMLGLAYGSLGNLEKATSEGNISRMLGYKYLSKVLPNDHEVRYRLGNSYSDMMRFDEAINEYLLSIKLNENNSRAYNNLGIAYFNKGNTEEAKKSFLAAVKIDPGNRDAAYNLSTTEKLILQKRP